jgi:hypothetical protein
MRKEYQKRLKLMVSFALGFHRADEREKFGNAAENEARR